MACSLLTGDHRRVVLVYLKVLSTQDIRQSDRDTRGLSPPRDAFRDNRSAATHRIKKIHHYHQILGPISSVGQCPSGVLKLIRGQSTDRVQTHLIMERDCPGSPDPCLLAVALLLVHHHDLIRQMRLMGSEG